MRWAPFFVVLLLAGCTEAPAEADGKDFVDEQSFDEFELEQTEPEFGIIKGVVVDPAITPLEGVLVTLVGQGRNVTSNAAGAFAFKDVAAGTYFLEAQRERFVTIQASVDVVAGVKDPKVVRILMNRQPGTEPVAVGDVFQGHITCSIRIPTAGFNDGCGAFGDLGLGSTQRTDLSYDKGNMHWWQAEVIWEAGSATAERLCHRVSADTLAGGDVCTASPAVQQMDADLLDREGVDDGAEFEVVVFPDHYTAGVSGNLVIDQGFEIVHYAFYNFVPPEGWTFFADGEPLVPP